MISLIEKTRIQTKFQNDYGILKDAMLMRFKIFFI